jgi:hypothetical protein
LRNRFSLLGEWALTEKVGKHLIETESDLDFSKVRFGKPLQLAAFKKEDLIGGGMEWAPEHRFVAVREIVFAKQAERRKMFCDIASYNLYFLADFSEDTVPCRFVALEMAAQQVPLSGFGQTGLVVTKVQKHFVSFVDENYTTAPVHGGMISKLLAKSTLFIHWSRR